MISLIPATAGRRTDIMMSQQTSQATQERIDELIRRTQEKEEERKKKRRDLQAGEATVSSSSQEHQPEPTKGQETTKATSKMGCTILVRHISIGDESERMRKADDKSRQEEEVDVEEWEETTTEHGGESTEGDEDFNDEPPIVEFKDPTYEFSQSYELEPEYEDMTPEQEAAEVQALTERSRNLDRSFRNIYIIPSFPTREQHAHSVQNARSRFTKLNQSYSC